MRVKTLPVLLLVTLSALGVGATAPARAADGDLQWLRQFGAGPSTDNAMAVAAGPEGVFVVGETNGPLPGQVDSGGGDAYIRRYDRDGGEGWTRQFGTPSDDGATGVAVSSAGVFVVGWTYGSMSGQPYVDNADAFIRMYDLDGTERWTREFGTYFDNCLRCSVSVDDTGVYVSGDIDGGALSGQETYGQGDAFVRKYGLDGTELWTRQFGSPGRTAADAISVHDRMIYVAGWVYDAFPGQVSAGGRDAFVRAYSPEGTESWTRQFGTETGDWAGGVAVDASGVYVTGSTDGFFPGDVGATDPGVFLRKYGLDGTEQWTRQIGSGQYSTPGGVVAHPTGIYVAGTTRVALPGQVAAGQSDLFVRRYDADGAVHWTRQFGSDSYEESYGISADGDGVYLSGSTWGTFPGYNNAGAGATVLARFELITPSDPQYRASSFFQPINDGVGAQSVFKHGTTIPVKFALLDANGDAVDDTTAQSLASTCAVTISVVGAEVTVGGVNESTSAAAGSSGNCFRYHNAQRQFIFNLSTKPLAGKTNYRLAAVLSSDSIENTLQEVVIGLR